MMVMRKQIHVASILLKVSHQAECVGLEYLNSGYSEESFSGLIWIHC